MMRYGGLPIRPRTLPISSSKTSSPTSRIHWATRSAARRCSGKETGAPAGRARRRSRPVPRAWPRRGGRVPRRDRVRFIARGSEPGADFSRSSAVMRVSLPRGMAFDCTACTRTRRPYWRTSQSFDAHVFRRFGETGMFRAACVADRAMMLDNIEHFGIGHLKRTRRGLRRGHRDRRGERDGGHGRGPAIGVEIVAGVVAVDEMAHQAADDDDQRDHEPRIGMAVEHRIMVRDHHQSTGSVR
jgi:hypothetical protein